jgi:hypothetical protein
LIRRQWRHASLNVLHSCKLWWLGAVRSLVRKGGLLFIGLWFGGACGVHGKALRLLVAPILGERLIGGRQVFFIVRYILSGIHHVRGV